MRRRDRNRRRLRRLAVIITLLAFVAVATLPVFNRGAGNMLHNAALEIVGLGQRGATALFSSITGVWEDYVALRNVRKRNRELEAELDEYRRTLIKYSEAAALNARLKKLLDLKEETESPNVTARIIGRDTSSWFRTITVDRGADDGIRPGMPVITVEGIVGRVMEASSGISTIILCIDPNSAVDGLIQHCRAQGIIKGNGEGYIFNYVMKNLDVRKNDMIVTSGMSGVFPKGIPIGRVSMVSNTARGMFQEVRVEPAVNFGQLEFVMILLRENPLTMNSKGRN